MNLLTELGALDPIADGRIQWMGAAVETDVGAEEGARADGHQTCIDNYTVEVDKDSFANADIEAIINVNGTLDPWIALEQCFVCHRVCRWCW